MGGLGVNKMRKNLKQVSFGRTTIRRNESTDGEMLETKIERMVTNKEPISEGAARVYQERKDGVQAGYNIRTDRFEVALAGSTIIEKSVAARRDTMHIVKDEEEDGKPESTDGTN